jgi:hypothetical protein
MMYCKQMLNQCVLGFGLWFLAISAWAHPSPQSEVLLVAEQGHVRAELTLPLDELQLAFQQPLMNARAERALLGDAEMKAYLAAHIRPVAPDGRAWVVQVSKLRWILHDRPADLKATVVLTPPLGAPADDFVLGCDVISHQVQSHVTLVALQAAAGEAAQPVMLGTLRFGQHSLHVKVANEAWWDGMGSMFKLGMLHIAEGSDHLLFLLTLLLPAPLLVAGGKWGEFGGSRHLIMRLAGIVTAFTIGHSLTLVLGATGQVVLPAQPVEIAIAVSILVSAIHALRPVFAHKEYLIAAAFGLIHGLAFATAIKELELSGARLAAGILAFNLGIESVQLLIVTVSAPLLILLARTRHYQQVRKILAIGSGTMALFWMAERILAV